MFAGVFNEEAWVDVVMSRLPQPGLRKLLQKGDYFLGAVIASTLTKLALRTQELHGECHHVCNDHSVLISSLTLVIP